MSIEVDEVQPSDEEAALRAHFAVFLEANPLASLVHDDERWWIDNPWGDDTIRLRVRDDHESLAEALASVYLPPRFSAIYHVDTRELEFVWAAFMAGSDEDEDLVGRKFDLHFDGQVLECEWGQSSGRLLEIARASRPEAAPTSTYWRNLNFYSRYLKELDQYEGESPETEVGVARSFWVRGVDWAEDEMTEVARHISYYMKYFDLQTPIINIHEEVQAASVKRRGRYPHGDFPTTIVGHRLDSYLLGLWETALLETDAFLRYLYCYQILEYAVYYFLKEDTARRVKKILVEPDVCARPETATLKVIDILGAELRKPEDEKLRDVLREHVRPSEVWHAIEPNKDVFAAETVFDGGFRLDPLINGGETDGDAWAKTGFNRLADQLRYLRNALAHARDVRGGGILKPSQGNYESVRVWLQPMEAVMTEVVLRSHTVDGN